MVVPLVDRQQLRREVDVMRLLAISCTLAASVALAATAATAAEPRKGHSEYLASLTARSLKDGFPAGSVRLLDVVLGQGRDASARAMLDRLAGGDLGRRLKLAGLRPVGQDRRILTFIGAGAHLDVFADGSKLRVRGAIDDPREIERAGIRPLEQNELEQLGHRFIVGPLAPFVRLGRDETLTFLGVRYFRESEANTTQPPGTAEQPRVIANIAVFGRTVAGIPVIGSGSKLAVWFDNSRELVALDIDWPAYSVSSRIQTTLARAELARRVAATTIPLDGARDATVRRFECGYVDLGATRRAQVIQAGCSIAYEGSGAGGAEAWGRVEYVPAGTQVLEESHWPLANALAAGRVVNTSSPEFQRFMTGPKAPPDPPPAQR
jgi:hypothetical protein